DRFGLSVEVTTPTDLADRIEVVKRRDAFERDPKGFGERWHPEDEKVRRRILKARERVARVSVPDTVLERAAKLCIALGTDGLRGELTLMRAARALAALEGDAVVGDAHLRRIAPSALRHRLRRDPLDDTGSGARVERVVAELMPA
ncbi:MAG: magnesium chelatase ATPase subunit I, partial [Burkholderiales bacterium]|nr:magnesium chelatase ATPase subunit I [Burkholderiales bacterium]